MSLEVMADCFCVFEWPARFPRDDKGLIRTYTVQVKPDVVFSNPIYEDLIFRRGQIYSLASDIAERSRDSPDTSSDIIGSFFALLPMYNRHLVHRHHHRHLPKSISSKFHSFVAR